MNNITDHVSLINILKTGSIRIRTDLGELEFPHSSSDSDSAEYKSPFADITLSFYNKGGDTVYRGLVMRCLCDLTLYGIDFITEFGEIPIDHILYNSFIDSPSAAFVRYDNIGFYTGIENPFFSSRSYNDRVTLSYEPSLMLKRGEIYEAEPQFLGSYIPTGEYIKEPAPMNIDALKRRYRRPRFFNPCGEIPLDKAERDALRKYVREYYDVFNREFNNILYFYFYPKKPFPETDEEVKDYISTVDRFSEICGDTIAFNPHTKTSIPTADKPYWELAPENSCAEKILRYAQSRGMRCGYYMGCAFNGEGGNAALLPYMPEKTEWKKIDAYGGIASENCLGCDEYLDWYFTVQKNTIEKYSLGYWAWDPGPGNGNDCYAKNHGHIPGKGEYKGWRNSMRLLARMRETFPKIFLMSFYGRKEYGIWGFKYFSQHEVYWEQTVLFGATLHNDLDDDRVNADGTRLQNAWSMNFRFLPAELGHGLVTRMAENSFDPEMDRAYDFAGFRFSLLSAIACCGSVTHCTLPDKLENVPGYREFYKKWIGWARDNYRYCAYTKPIGNNVSNEQIDGFARIAGDSGQIFLFNPSPKIMRKKLLLDSSLGFDTKKGFYLRFLYCESTDFEEKQVQYRGLYHMDDILDITLPPYGAVVLELSDSECESIFDIPRNTHTIDCFTDSEGVPFVYPEHPSYESIALSTNAVFLPELKNILDAGHIENEEFLSQKIPIWHNNKMPFTFVSSLTHRLVLYIPFDGPILPAEVKLFISGTEVPIYKFYLWHNLLFHYAFVEDYVKWGCDNDIRLEIKGLAENSFMGIYAVYPDKCNGILADEVVFSERVIGSRLYHDSSLVIDSVEVTPDALSDIGERFTVTVKTGVKSELIENVYYTHPRRPMMSELSYNRELDVWQASSDSGDRALSIFCNPEITVWIKSKDGGIGPRAGCKLGVRYTGNHK